MEPLSPELQLKHWIFHYAPECSMHVRNSRYTYSKLNWSSNISWELRGNWQGGENWMVLLFCDVFRNSDWRYQGGYYGTLAREYTKNFGVTTVFTKNYSSFWTFELYTGNSSENRYTIWAPLSDYEDYKIKLNFI